MIRGVMHVLVPEEDAIDNIPANRDRDHPKGKKISTHADRWRFFGGKVDRGADKNPAATAIRETREETGRLRRAASCPTSTRRTCWPS